MPESTREEMWTMREGRPVKVLDRTKVVWGQSPPELLEMIAQAVWQMGLSRAARVLAADLAAHPSHHAVSRDAVPYQTPAMQERDLLKALEAVATAQEDVMEDLKWPATGATHPREDRNETPAHDAQKFGETNPLRLVLSCEVAALTQRDGTAILHLTKPDGTEWLWPVTPEDLMRFTVGQAVTLSLELA